ncbi:hypothetical protein KY284_034511 [Solanum tuberosum]|nr:hypothetical protein KY284_034511 [Solanum tuberosum]
MLSDHMFERDLPKSKSSKSNILAASENMVIESLAQMRKAVRNEEGSSSINDLLGDYEPVFDQTPEVGVPPSTEWAVQRRMVPVTTKGKQKVTEETPKRKLFTKATSQKLMSDTMKSSETNTVENRRRRRYGEVVTKFPHEDVVDVSNELSKN